MKLISLFSGSSGNCIYVEDGNCRLLFDAGVTCRKIKVSLAQLGLEFKDIDAIFVTHEHIDHVAGLGVISRNSKIPIFCNKLTYDGMCRQKDHPAEAVMNLFCTGNSLYVKDLEIKSFPISHDAADPVGYRINNGKISIGIATDTGKVTNEIKESLSGCKAMLVEANHDLDMLKTGPYPQMLKQRILSDYGHLSNNASGEVISELINTGCEKILLGHLSKTNNTPFSAFNTVENILKSNGYKRDIDYVLNVARRDGISDGVEI